MDDLVLRRVRLRGNSFVLTIPMSMAREIGIVDDEYLYCARVKKQIVVGRGKFRESVANEIDESDTYVGAVEAMMKQIADQEEAAERRAARATPGAGQHPAGEPAAAAGPRPRSKLERLQFK